MGIKNQLFMFGIVLSISFTAFGYLQTDKSQFNPRVLLGSQEKLTRKLLLSNISSQTINWHLADANDMTLVPPGWLSITPASGTLGPNMSQSLLLDFTIANLPAGTHRCTFWVLSTNAGIHRQQVNVNLEVVGPELGLTYGNLRKEVLMGSTEVLSDKVTISNVGGGILNWKLMSVPSWLTITPETGSLSAGQSQVITLIYNYQGLPGGTYSDGFSVYRCETNGGIGVNVQLKVIGPSLNVSKSKINFAAVYQGNNPADQTLTVKNSGGGVINWSIDTTNKPSWLSISQTSGSLLHDQIDTITFSSNITGLAAGNYNWRCILGAQGVGSSYIEISLLVKVSYDWSTNPGKGTPDDPYQIATLEHLMAIGSEPNLVNKHYILMSDLDMSAYISLHLPLINGFSGGFDGNGHVIRNVILTTDSAPGLFGSTRGVIENLGLENILINGYGSVSGLVSNNYGGTIKNCYVTGSISSQNGEAAGLCGRNTEGTIIDCYFDGTLCGKTGVAGICGYNQSQSKPAVIKNCHARGSMISGRDYLWDYIGGVCGTNEKGTIDGCHSDISISGARRLGGLCGYNNAGIVQNCYASGSIIGFEYVGGLIGQTNGAAEIKNCYATGDVSGGKYDIYTGGKYAGGLCGEAKGAKIIECFASGNVTSMGDCAGGLCGYGGIWINNSYALGNVSGIYNVGGVVGYSEGIIADQCFAKGAVSGKSSVGGFIGRTYFYGDIKNCYAEGTVNSLGSAGGFAGYSWAKLTNCYASGAVAGAGTTGGLVGYSGDNSINYCYATGDVSSPGDYVGGLAGKIENSYFIRFNYATGSVTGRDYVGGLIGHTKYYLQECFATGAVSGRYYVGGLTGRGDAMVSYSTGPVNGNDRVGGLVGSGRFYACYTASPVTSAGSYVGGLAGEFTGTALSESFWDTQTCGITKAMGNVPPNPAGAYGLPTSQMMMLSTYTSLNNQYWDFSTTDGDPAYWMMPEGGYPMLAWQPVDEDSSYSGGSGTLDDPYQIADANDFTHLCSTSQDWSKHFILMSDIDLAGTTYTDSPIAPDTDDLKDFFQGVPFSGSFDGNGHSISNLIIEAPEKDYIGLFGRLTCRSIENLQLVNAHINGKDYVGAVAGHNCFGLIENCHTQASVTGSSLVGGIAGENVGTIRQCSVENSVNISGKDNYCYGGGLAGSNTGTIDKSFNAADVIADGNDVYVGGIAGMNSGDITSAYTTGDVTAQAVFSNCSGGCIGYMAAGSVSYSYSTGKVTAAAGSVSVGGFIGHCELSALNIISCFWDIESSDLRYSSGGKPVNSLLMKNVSTFQNAGWTDKGWIIEDEIDTPRLAWQDTEGMPITAPAPYFTGKGTNSEPYLVYTAEEFAMLSWRSDILSSYITLMNDLDLTGVPLCPIGDLGPFTGEFNGNNHTISNAAIEQPGSDFIGLFGRIGPKGSISLLNVVNAKVAGNDCVGGLAGQMSGLRDSGKNTFYGKLVSCSFTGSVKATGLYAGGISGWNRYFSISDCSADVDVKGKAYVGGVSGYLTEEGKVAGCSASGTVKGEGNYIGGLVGYHFITPGSIDQCSAAATVAGIDYVGGLAGACIYTYSSDYSGYQVTNCSAAGTVHGYNFVGGLAGSLIGHYYSRIADCMSSAAVNGEGNYIGGLIGYKNGPRVNQCGATGAVHGFDYVGGLFGFSNSGYKDEYCFAENSVHGNNYVGGLLGKGSIACSYAICSVQGKGDYIGGLAGMTSGLDACYTAGSVNAKGNYVGAVAGVSSNGFRYVFWDTQTTKLKQAIGNISPDPVQIKGLPTGDMMKSTTYTGTNYYYWHFTTDKDQSTRWVIREGEDYPRLWWQTLYAGDGQ